MTARELLEKYTKEDSYLFFLLEDLTRYLLPELIPLIRYYTFAPYQITGILRKDGDDVVRPITLSCYSLLPVDLRETYFSITMPTLHMTLKREDWGLYISMDLPTQSTPLACHWEFIEKTPLHHVFRCMIEEANLHLRITKANLTVRYGK